MDNPSVLDYFNSLSQMMLDMQATDISGTDISLESASVQALDMIIQIQSSGRKIMLVGNGGSSAIASHAQNDLAESAGVRAMVFTEPPVLTARSNDHGYGSVYERPVEMWGESGDLLYAISSSGQSENILRAIRAAQEKECHVITLTGFKEDNPARLLGGLNFYVGSSVYGYVESAHTAFTHFLTTGIDARLKALGVLPSEATPSH